MFIGHYKCVKSALEFYSVQRDNLNFPTQVVYKNERYLLFKSIQISSKKQYERVISTAKQFNIDTDVEID